MTEHEAGEVCKHH